MHVDRRGFIASVGGAAAVAALGHQDYEFARNHRYYMEARLGTVNDQYSFDENQREIKVSVSPVVGSIAATCPRVVVV